MAKQKRVGVIGCGLIAQVMHLPYLAELSDRFEIAALCDVSEEVVQACARRYDVSRTFTSAGDLLEEPLDAVMVLIPGDHAPIGIAAADRGINVFVEKPMAISAAQCARMIRAADATDVCLMVGTMKRYDRAYERFVELVPKVEDPRLVRVVTLESPLEPYVAHYPLERATGAVAPELTAQWEAEERPHLDLALDSDPDATTRFVFRNILLDNLVHEFNMLRGAFGEPTEVCYASLDPKSIAVHLRFGDLNCHLSWVDLPGIARYKQEVALHGPDERVVLTFPSPFLRSAPTSLAVEGGQRGSADAWSREEVVSYEEAFKRELEEFHDVLVSGRAPRTPGEDGLRDLLLCEAVARAHRTGTSVANPTEPPASIIPEGGEGRQL